jgi:hypothetical protein
MGISVGTTAIAFVLMNTSLVQQGQKVSQPFYPGIFIFGFSYIISSFFIGVLNAGANAILHAVLIDVNDPKLDTIEIKPHHTKNVKEFLEKLQQDVLKLDTESQIHQRLLEND